MLYNPAWILSLNTECLMGVICHEVMHCVLGHHTRRGNRDPQLWNIACDFAINIIIYDARIALPKERLLDSKYRNMSAEKIYDLLDKNPCSKQALASSQFGDVQDAKGTEEEVQAQAKDWQLAAAMATIAAEAMGAMPESIKRVIGELLNPKLPWKEILNRFVVEKAKDDFCWQRPNKRYLWSGTYLPSLDSLRLKTVGIAVDTSGSINNTLFNEFITEMKSILAVCPNSEAEVVYVDSAVQGSERLTSTTDRLSPVGGGGTDFRPAFKYFDELDEEVSCIVYFTDGYCDSFPSFSSVPLLWIVARNSSFNPPLGEVIYLDK